MAWENKEDKKDESWAFSTEPSSAEVHDNNKSGVSAFSTENAQNWGQRGLSNWGEEPRLDDPAPVKGAFWGNLFRKLFG